MQIDPDLIEDEAADGDVFRTGGATRPRRRTGRRDLDVLAVIALGGGLGSLARYGVEQLLPSGDEAFPWATFSVNLGGCLALGVLMVFVTEVWGSGRYARPFFGIGVLGGLTTFSSLTLELRTLTSAGGWLLATGYLLGTIAGGLLAVWAGMATTRWLTAHRGRSDIGRS